MRVFAFDFSKAFDSMKHFILFKKCKVTIQPLCDRLVTKFFEWTRQQRVIVNGTCTSLISTNNGVSQRNILGSVLFSVMVSDIFVVYCFG